MKSLVLRLVEFFMEDIEITVNEKNLPPIKEDPISFSVEFKGDIWRCDARFKFEDESDILTVHRQYTRELIEALQEALEDLN